MTTIGTQPGELMPCPFCGSPALIVQASNDPNWWIIRCTDQADDAAMCCRAVPEVQEDNRELAIAHWNHREPSRTHAAKPEAPWKMPCKVDARPRHLNIFIRDADESVLVSLAWGMDRDYQSTKQIADAICAAINLVYGSAVK